MLSVTGVHAIEAKRTVHVAGLGRQKEGQLAAALEKTTRSEAGSRRPDASLWCDRRNRPSGAHFHFQPARQLSEKVELADRTDELTEGCMLEGRR